MHNSNRNSRCYINRSRREGKKKKVLLSTSIDNWKTKNQQRDKITIITKSCMIPQTTIQKSRHYPAASEIAQSNPLSDYILMKYIYKKSLMSRHSGISNLNQSLQWLSLSSSPLLFTYVDGVVLEEGVDKTESYPTFWNKLESPRNWFCCNKRFWSTYDGIEFSWDSENPMFVKPPTLLASIGIWNWLLNCTCAGSIWVCASSWEFKFWAGIICCRFCETVSGFSFFNDNRMLAMFNNSGFINACAPNKPCRFRSDGFPNTDLRTEDMSRRSSLGAWVTGSIPIRSSLFLMWVFQ